MTKPRNFLILLIMLISLFRLPVKADEGMWIPMFIERLNYQDMKEMGLQLTPEEIYSVNNGSLKDAIVIFGRGCTGEIISEQGLLLTNHHCGYGSIQSVSSVENDYLSDGFWASSHEEEIPIPGLTVQFLIRMDDVTSRMLEGVDASMSESDRSAKLSENRKAIVEEATADTHYNAVVKDYFEGNEFYLLTYETFRDVRLVGTPPEAIGKYGADTDNWMWPRHTGDFSMFRVYAGADNKPADYSADNKPFKPRHSLPVSIAGIEKGDFSMIMGNPGSTDRYLTSFGVDLAIKESNPTIVKIDFYKPEKTKTSYGPLKNLPPLRRAPTRFETLVQRNYKLSGMPSCDHRQPSHMPRHPCLEFEKLKASAPPPSPCVRMPVRNAHAHRGGACVGVTAPA